MSESPLLHLRDELNQSQATLAPERGGMLIGLTLCREQRREQRRERLYLDRATFDDPKANVRGGVPVLFPSPGKLTGDAWARDGVSGKLKQHGFARNMPWTVSAATATSATLSLRSTDETRADYPFSFAVDFTYALEAGGLIISMRFENTAKDGPRMPFGAGFHPYFAVPQADKAKVVIPTQATRAWDNTQKREVPFTGFDLTATEVDMHLLDHGSSRASLRLGEDVIELEGSSEFTHWVVWTLRGKDFVCLEPWTCPGDALNTGERLLWLEPGASRTLSLSITLKVDRST